MTDRPVPRVTRAQLAGVTLGNWLEFYDFVVYAFFATQIAATFFPGGGLLPALATFGAGFLTRPLGALVLGRLGDRVGRRPAMLTSFALIGAAGAGVALTPGAAAIGRAAPALVIAFRLVQGFALGGEVGASTAFLLEAAPADRRGLYVSLQFVGQNGAALLAGLAGVALSATLGPAALAAWGWRVAFGLGVLVLPVGLALRRTLPETREPAPPPPAAGELERVALPALLLLTAGTIATYVGNYMTTYATTTLGMAPTLALGATVVVGLCGTAFSPVGGLLADQWGRRPVILAALAALLVLTIPAFRLIAATREAVPLYAMTALLRTAIALAQAAALVAIAELLPARSRSAMLAILYAVAIAVFGGSTQFAVQWLIERTGNPLAPAWLLTGAAAVGLGAGLMLPESAPRRRARAQ